MTDNEQISRLLGGDLAPEEVAGLRARLAVEPALAAKYAALQGVLAAIPSLGVALPPPGVPRALRAAAATVVPRESVWRGRLVASLLGAALAAGALLALRAPTPQIVLLRGTTVVDGHVLVLAGGLPLEIVGRARISVEPPAGGVREKQAELETMDRTHLAAAFAGALVSVAVLEGHARITDSADTAPRTVDAGESADVTVGGHSSLTGRLVSAGTPAPPKDLAAAQSRIRDLEHQLAVAKLDAGISHGVVRAHEGKPQPWPADVPAAFRPENFRARLDEAVRTVPGAAIAEVDCDEFPCVAVLATVSEADDWSDALGGIQQSLSHDPRFGEVAVTAMAQATDDGEGQHRLYAFALTPAPAGEDGEQRTQYRAKSLMEELGGGSTEADPRTVEQLRMLGYLGN